MHRTTLLSRYLAAAFAYMALFPASTQALTLGNLVVQSHLGQPMRAQIPVRTGPDETLDASCVSLGRTTDQDYAPYLTQAKLSVENSAEGHLIRIHSSQSINEPVIRLLVRVTCGGQISLSREFTVLLDPQDYAKTPLPAKEELPLARPEEHRATPRPGSEWKISAGDSLDSLTSAIYPTSRSRQKRMKQAILSANPQIFKHGLEDSLPVGRTLRIPSLPAPTAGLTLPASKPARKTQRKEIRESFQLKLATGEIDLSVSRNLSEKDRLVLREKQLLLEADDQVANILALKNRVKQLESQLNELSLKIASQINENSTPPAPQVDKPQKPTVSGSQPMNGSNRQAFWLGLAGLTVMLGTFLSIRHHRQKQADAQDLQSFHWATPAPVSVPKPPAAPATTMASTSYKPPAPVEEADYDPHSIFQMPEEKISLTEVDSVIEEADLYLIYGWTQKAIDLLRQYIEKHPLEIQPWLMLLDIYHSGGMKEAFDQLAPAFRERFDEPEAWHKVQTLGHTMSPKNPLYISEIQPAQVTINSAPTIPESAESKTAEEAENDYWSHSRVDVARKAIPASPTPNQSKNNNGEAPLPRLHKN